MKQVTDKQLVITQLQTGNRACEVRYPSGYFWLDDFSTLTELA